MKYKKEAKLRYSLGFGIAELLIVVSLVGLIFITGITGYYTQLKKGGDARIKKDFGQLRTYLEDYFSDNNSYPSSSQMVCDNDLSPWIRRVPCYPDGTNYYYETNAQRSWYRMYAELKNEIDPSIKQAGCEKLIDGGCPNNHSYNYGISSGIPL